jgi:hypothetical protein
MRSKTISQLPKLPLYTITHCISKIETQDSDDVSEHRRIGTAIRNKKKKNLLPENGCKIRINCKIKKNVIILSQTARIENKNFLERIKNFKK